MKIPLQLITGLLFIANVRNENTTSEVKCITIKLKANCTSKNFSSIPQDLDMNLIDLDVSYNPIKVLKQDHFERYRSLLTLTLRWLNPESNYVSIESDVFTPMNDLVNLDIRDSPFDINSTEIINWPTKLRHLSIAALLPFQFSQLNLSNLMFLEELNASFHNLHSFPEFHSEAPLYWIDLYGNPMTNLTVEHLAPFCILSYLRLGNVENPGKLKTEEYSCHCRRLEQWMLMYNIIGFEMECVKPQPNKPDPCQFRNFSQSLINQRRTCLARQPSWGFWKWLLFLLLLSLLLPIIYISIEAYKSYKMKKGTDGTSLDEIFSGTVSVPDVILDAPLRPNDTPSLSPKS